MKFLCPFILWLIYFKYEEIGAQEIRKYVLSLQAKKALDFL